MRSARDAEGAPPHATRDQVEAVRASKRGEWRWQFDAIHHPAHVRVSRCDYNAWMAPGHVCARLDSGERAVGAREAGRMHGERTTLRSRARARACDAERKSEITRYGMRHIVLLGRKGFSRRVDSTSVFSLSYARWLPMWSKRPHCPLQCWTLTRRSPIRRSVRSAVATTRASARLPSRSPRTLQPPDCARASRARACIRSSLRARPIGSRGR